MLQIKHSRNCLENKLMGVEANTNKTEYVHPLVEHKAGHTRYFGD